MALEYEYLICYVIVDRGQHFQTLLVIVYGHTQSAEWVYIYYVFAFAMYFHTRICGGLLDVVLPFPTGCDILHWYLIFYHVVSCLHQLTVEGRLATHVQEWLGPHSSQ